MDSSDNSHDDASDDLDNQYVSVRKSSAAVEPSVDSDSDDESEVSDEVDEPTMSFHAREAIIVPPDMRYASDIMNTYEMAEYVSIRSVQIAKFGNCMTNISNLSSSIDMAKRELMHRKSPLILERRVGTRYNKRGQIEYVTEYWDPNEMIFAIEYDS